jgi:hypothetical protein
MKKNKKKQKKQRNVHGETALMFAAAKGHLEVALALLQMGADSKLTDLSGASAVHWALSGQVCARAVCVHALMRSVCMFVCLDVDLFACYRTLSFSFFFEIMSLHMDKFETYL